MQTSRPKVFYGWIIVAGGFFMVAASIGVMNNTLSVFVRPVTEAMGFSRGAFSFYNTVRSVSGMLVLPFYGEMFRKGHIKRTMLISTFLMGAALMGYSLCQELWHFYLCAVLQGIAYNGINSMGVSVVVNNWFREKKGFATGLALSGSGLGAAVMIPIVTYVVDTFGWRWGYRAMSVTGVIILLPVIVLVMRSKPSDMGLAPFGTRQEEGAAPADDTGFTRSELMGMPGFYLLLFGFFVSVMSAGCFDHTMAYLIDIGHSSLFASSVISVSMFALIFGKIIFGWVFDRFGALVGCVSTSISIIAAGGLLFLAGAAPAAYLSSVTLGYSFAFGSVAPSLLVVRYFGARDYARLNANMTMAASFAMAMSQPIPGFIYDFTGSYLPAWGLLITLAALSILIFFMADRSLRQAWGRRIATDAVSVPLDAEGGGHDE